MGLTRTEQPTQAEDNDASRIPHMLRELCLKVEFLNNHCEDPSKMTLPIKEASFLSALAILTFCSQIVNFMRSDEWYESFKYVICSLLNHFKINMSQGKPPMMGGGN